MDVLATAHEMTLSELPDDPAWLGRFHAGERAVLEQCYRDHFAKALTAATRILSGIDAETVTHEVFYRLLSDERTRRGFGGGNLGAWIAKVTANAAIDHHRRRRREVGEEPEGHTPDVEASRMEDELDAKLLVDRFCRERLPPKWNSVFEIRFLRQLPQREAALELGMQRSTLAYQEQQIRTLLSDFLLASEEP
jgi:RNA polymerase sigma-70 factor (ECF subfamily)